MFLTGGAFLNLVLTTVTVHRIIHTHTTILEIIDTLRRDNPLYTNEPNEIKIMTNADAKNQELWLVLTATSDKGASTTDMSDMVTPYDVENYFSDTLGDDYTITGVYSNFSAIDFIEKKTVDDNVFDILELTFFELDVLTAYAYEQGTHIFCESSKLISSMTDEYIPDVETEKELGEWHVNNFENTSGLSELMKSCIDYESIGETLFHQGIYKLLASKTLPEPVYHWFYNPV